MSSSTMMVVGEATSLISAEVSVEEAPAPPTAPNVSIAPSSLVSSEIVVEEAPAPAPPEERVEIAPPRRPWWIILLLLAGGGYLLTRRKEKK